MPYNLNTAFPSVQLNNCAATSYPKNDNFILGAYFKAAILKQSSTVKLKFQVHFREFT